MYCIYIHTVIYYRLKLSSEIISFDDDDDDDDDDIYVYTSSRF